VLGSVVVGSAVFHSITSLLILLVFELIALRQLPITLVWLPLVWLPLVLASLSCTWILSAAGVFLRDIGQLVGVALNMLMFLSPIFFPVSALPEKWQPFLALNPLAQSIEQTRRTVLEGLNPDWRYVVLGSLTGLVVCELSFRAFQKSKRAFADVL
jgi:lipopolysaccharide transport system permease protein